jgi:hypothetical protein
VKYPQIYKYWIEFETLPGWDSSMPLRSGCSTLEEVAERLEELMGLGEPWASRTYRVVDPEGRAVATAPA